MLQCTSMGLLGECVWNCRMDGAVVGECTPWNFMEKWSSLTVSEKHALLQHYI